MTYLSRFCAAYLLRNFHCGIRVVLVVAVVMVVVVVVMVVVVMVVGNVQSHFRVKPELR